MATILEKCQVHPSPGSYEDLSLPLSHFDIPFLQSYPSQRLFFFKLPWSKSRFLETIVPELKKSLAVTLTHFLPLAGAIVLPLESGWPVIRYVPGDSVSLTVAECYKDFDHLTGNHQRLADDFYACIPQQPQPRHFTDQSVVLPVLAFQITVFPGQGICLGLSNHHAAMDESSFINFMRAWVAVNKSGGDDHSTYCPSFDRTIDQDPQGLDFQTWSLMKRSPGFPKQPTPLSAPINKVRATFIMTRNQVQNLKNCVLANKPNICYVSSFTVVFAFIWACYDKSSSVAAEEANNNEPVYFGCGVECRARLNPRLPSSYFGNCLVLVTTRLVPALLHGDDGFLIAAESLGEAIQKTVHGEKGTILDRADLPLKFQKYGGKRFTSVTGSPRFAVYDIDFGWGRPNKYEFVHLDNDKSISLCSSRDHEGGFEIGLSMTKVEMDLFERFFDLGSRDVFGTRL